MFSYKYNTKIIDLNVTKKYKKKTNINIIFFFMNILSSNLN